MKNVLISGISWFEREQTEVKEGLQQHKLIVNFRVQIWGQAPDSPELEYINSIEHRTSIGYDALVGEVKEIYCEYFGVSESDVRVFSNITNLHSSTMEPVLNRIINHK